MKNGAHNICDPVSREQELHYLGNVFQANSLPVTCEEDPVSTAQSTSSTTLTYLATTEDPVHPICSWSKWEAQEDLRPTEHLRSLYTGPYPETDTHESEDPGTGGEKGHYLSGPL